MDRAEKLPYEQHKVTQLHRTLRILIVMGGFVLIFFCMVQIASVLAGKQTSANIDMDLRSRAQLGASPPALATRNQQATGGRKSYSVSTRYLWDLNVLWALVAATGIAYGLHERSLRKHTIAHLAPFQKRYEQLMDPRRTSSDLTRTGDTPREE